MGKYQKKCRITEEENVPEQVQPILKKYWSFDGKKFKITPARVAKQFGLNSCELFDIVATYTMVYVYDHCKSCGMEMVTEVDCQVDFLEAYFNQVICEKCEEKLEESTLEESS